MIKDGDPLFLISTSILKHFIHQDTTAVEFEITATMTGEMQMPDGSKIPATNKTYTMSAWSYGNRK